ncbi:MAG: MarR family transcriptional regulator [Pseudorhodoplanes sp.]
MSIPPDAVEAAHLIDRLDRLSRSGVPVAGLNPAQWEALRYLARANRFSRTPAALADYLGSTRGTVSQTLITLAQKGFVSREPSERDRRVVELALTKRGVAALRQDPILALAEDVAQATGSEAAALVHALRATLRGALVRNNGRPFGVCRTCRHFRRNATPDSRMPHRCNLLDEPLSEADETGICVEQEPAA